MERAIRVHDLSKLYRVGMRQVGGYRTLRETLSDAITAPLHRLQQLRALSVNGDQHKAVPANTIWALKDVTFDVERGEVIGIIGRNGAGKSTLLKILSRITSPTKGRAELRGRVGCLLEVGTGFHQELTGRENIYLSGTILGMRRSEIQRSFDHIVEFAEVEKFIDTPVKRFSSGMHVRLAFAVAAHLNPEILLVDEVLAVGDIDFQRKCVGKMKEVGKTGRTIFFVSHNIPTIQSLCSRCILLEGGQMKMDGDAASVTQFYVRGNRSASHDNGEEYVDLSSEKKRRPGSRACIAGLRILDENGIPTRQFQIGDSVVFEVDFALETRKRNLAFSVFLTTYAGQRVLMFNTHVHSRIDLSGRQSGRLTCKASSVPLVSGNYYIDIEARTNTEEIDYVEEAASLTITKCDYLGTGRVPVPSQSLFVVPAEWSLD